jgi:hypothetical protein
MKRCWGPRPNPIVRPTDATAVVATVGDHHHAHSRTPARAFTFTANAEALARELSTGAPQAASRRWVLMVSGDQAVLTCGVGTGAGEPVPPTFIAWLHARGLCRGCARSSLRDARLQGLFVYQHHGRTRAAPYERIAEPITPRSPDEVAHALGLQREALQRSVLPVSFAVKDRLQPIEYVPCTWSETVPWESEAGDRHGVSVAPKA